MPGLIDFTFTNRRGDVLPGKVLRVERADGSGAAILYTDATGRTPLGSNLVITDDAGQVDVYADGEVRIVDHATNAVLRQAWPRQILDPAFQAELRVSETASAATVAAAFALLLPEQEAGSPAGMGREVLLPSRKLLTAPAGLSTLQSVRGAGVGATILQVDTTGLQAGQSYGVLKVLADSRSKEGVRGQGAVRSLSIDGARKAIEAAFSVGPGTLPAAYPVVHGYLADQDTKRGHAFAAVSVHNTTGHGVLLGLGADQARGDIRAEGARGTAIVIRSASDVKLERLAGNGSGRLAATDPTSLLIENAAPEITGGSDFWPEDDAALDKYTAVIRQCTGVFIESATITGHTLIKGKNAQGSSVRFEAVAHRLVGIKFKHKVRSGDGLGGVPLLHYLRVEDADEVQLVAPHFEWDRAVAQAQLPHYLISIGTEAGNQARSGSVSIVGGAGLLGGGRPDAAGADPLPLVGALKHICDRPKALRINGKPFGALDLVPAWMVSAPDPAVRTHIQVSEPGTARVVTKAQYPLAYLAATIDRGPGGVGPVGTNGLLDDGALTAPLPLGPAAPSSDYVWALPIRY